MRKNITLGLILSSAMALTTLAVAAPAGQADGTHQGRFSHRHGHGMGFEKLDLTDAQRASIKQIVRSRFAQNKTQWQALRQQRSAFQSMTPDQVGYQAAAASLAQAEADATRVRVQQRATVRAQIYALLTPAQKAQWASIKQEKQARRQQWQQFKAEHPAASSTTPPAQ
ncbi:Spy/CpxP family protein refolding chaperone [Rhodanobacter terrae]|uniref:Spy/CpxP family protein refolding chaperone n=1 Tax=Rhodanobacter terrae TaxID=418647 RepID=A0ABW0STL3_9GAMM